MRWRLLVGVVGVMLIQALLGYLAQMWIRPDPTNPSPLAVGLALLGLPLGPLPTPPAATGYPELWVLFVASMLRAIRATVDGWVLPAFCGWQLGMLRRDGTFRELLQEGHTPGRVLLAAGLAAAGPFLAASLLCSVVAESLVWNVAGQRPPSGSHGNLFGYYAQFWINTSLVRLLNCVLLVETGALGSGPWRGLWLCYAGRIGLTVLMSTVGLLARHGDWTVFTTNLAANAVLAGAPVLLLPITLRSLARESPPSDPPGAPAGPLDQTAEGESAT
ncbi:MAG: hypothetical protein FJX77_11520 [Armatimonadetes bacterium]|nr:hypothetical protein [Armatimonadota bacterium]